MSWKTFIAALVAMVSITVIFLAWLSRPKYVSLPNSYSKNYRHYSGR